MTQLVLPHLPDGLREAAERRSSWCECTYSHETGADADPCFCECHVPADQRHDPDAHWVAEGERAANKDET